MKLSSRIKPISYLKPHAAEIVRKLDEHREPLVITPERRSQGSHTGHRKLRANPGNLGSPEDPGARDPSDRGRQVPAR